MNRKPCFQHQQMNRTSRLALLPECWRVLGWLVVLLAGGTLLAADAQPDARVDELFGVARHKPRDRAEEYTLEKPGQFLFVGDRLRTLTNSHATVWLRERNPIKLGPKSVLELTAPPGQDSLWLNLLRGTLYFFSREKPRDVQVRTPHGTGAHAGTEFVVIVEDQRTLLAVYDGEASLTNDHGGVELKAGELGVARDGVKPVKMELKAANIIEWWLFYPAVLDAEDLEFTPAERAELQKSLDAYRAGDLPAAFAAYPGSPEPGEPRTDAGRIYLAELLLSAGQVDGAENLLRKLGTNSSPAEALRWIIAAVRGNVDRPPEVHTSASEWLGLSYYYQARHELPQALNAARQSVTLSPNFGFGWARVAELEFGFGRVPAARAALERSLQLAPRNAQTHALNGFLLSARNCFADARAAFEHAIELDSSLGNAWLGRGLIRLRTGDAAGGREDLQTAVILEPKRSLLRSYLGKAFTDAGRATNAALELHLAQALDPRDPTPWLYSALLNEDYNRFNDAVGDLEKSIALNDNRAVYRSQLLLDEDRAVRGANLAAIYRRAGLAEVGVSEAARAVTADYANHSAHLFLANSYNELRDPALANLRYETATFSEYLVANLLSPVGGSALSPRVSQQEYTRLFARDRLGLTSETTYLSSGDWQQSASQYGWLGNTGYALDVYYRSQNGERINNDLEQQAYSIQLKQQLTPSDSVYLQAIFSLYEGGDVRQLYDGGMADPGLRVKEQQLPNLFVGYHHQWSPGIHTLLLAGRLADDLRLRTPATGVLALETNSVGAITGALPAAWSQFDLRYRSEFEAMTFEGQQILELAAHTLILGARYQGGETKTEAELRYVGPIFGLFEPSYHQENSTDLTRLSVYAYDNWELLDSLCLSAGLAYDRITYPVNIDSAPISDVEMEKRRLSPKAGLIWAPDNRTTVRASYTRSLGGLFYDQSVRLEPTLVAGLNQAYRSLVPESVAGPVAGSEFETWGAAVERRLGRRTYVLWEGSLLQSTGARGIGFLGFDVNPINPAGAQQTSQTLDFEERSTSLAVNQLLGDSWSLGARYRLSHAELDRRTPQIPDSVQPAFHDEAVLHQVSLSARFNHRTGYFAQASASWWRQYNEGPALADEEFWQFNLVAGYRFPRNRAELSLGVLNLTDENYQLNPLTLHADLPRERTFFASFRFSF